MGCQQTARLCKWTLGPIPRSGEKPDHPQEKPGRQAARVRLIFAFLFPFLGSNFHR